VGKGAFLGKETVVAASGWEGEVPRRGREGKKSDFFIMLLDARHQFEQMAVRVAEVDTSTAIPTIQLSVLRISWITAICQPRFLCAFENRVELFIAYMKGVVMDIEPVGGFVVVIEVEREPLVHAHRSEISIRAFIVKAEDPCEKLGRGFLVVRRHDRVIELDGHGIILLCSAPDQ
jgi:hypothetical protein